MKIWYFTLTKKDACVYCIKQNIKKGGYYVF